MIDEFVYQFQSFCQYRAKMKNKTEQEVTLLKQFNQVLLITNNVLSWTEILHLSFLEEYI